MEKLTVEGFTELDNLVGLGHLLGDGKGEDKAASYLSLRGNAIEDMLWGQDFQTKSRARE